MKYMFKNLNPEEALEILRNETDLDEAFFLQHHIYVFYKSNLFDIEGRFESYFANYEKYIRNISNLCGPEILFQKIKQEFLPYAKDVLYNNYQGSIEEHPLYPNIKAAYDAAIKHYVENPEYYERMDKNNG